MTDLDGVPGYLVTALSQDLLLQKPSWILPPEMDELCQNVRECNDFQNINNIKIIS